MPLKQTMRFIYFILGFGETSLNKVIDIVFREIYVSTSRFTSFNVQRRKQIIFKIPVSNDKFHERAVTKIFKRFDVWILGLVYDPVLDAP